MKYESTSGPFMRFLSADDGAVTLDTIIWIPFMFLLSIAVADTFFIYLNYAEATAILEAANRAFAVGVYDDCAEFTARVNASLGAKYPSLTSTCNITDLHASSSISIAVGEMGLGVFDGFLENFNVHVSDIRSMEWMKADTI